MLDEHEQSVGIQPGENLIINWESVNKEKNLLVRESESNASLYEITRRTQEEGGLPIVAIIDEEHMFWSGTADKSAEVLNRIRPAVELRISATPKTTAPDEIVRDNRQDVIAAEMIKKEVVLNPDIELNFREERTLNESLIQAALKKREELAKMYTELGIPINPLLLIQLPNDTKESLSTEDQKVAEFVKNYLQTICGITVKNSLLAVWLANEKENLADLESPDNMVQVLLFKEAIALGWDCPRAAVLLIFRKLESYQFTIQTIGRIMRMPEQKHYRKEPLNIGYVYTDIAKEKIQIVTADAEYIRKDILTARRRESFENVSLPAYYSERPNVERNYLGPDFKKTLYRVADEFFKQERGAGLFSIAEMAELEKDSDTLSLPFKNDDETINENRRRVEKLLRLDVKTINVEIPQDVHFQNEVQTLEVHQVRYARKASEINRVFMDYISKKGSQFESKGRTDKIANYLIEMLEEYFGVYDTDAKKVVLYSANRPKFDLLLDKALEIYARKRESAKARSAATRDFKQYKWEVPEERMYDSETNYVVEEVKTHALLPFVQLMEASNPEKNFIAFLEQNSQYIDWWYKNGDKGKQHFAIVYGEGDNKSLFYVDFIIRMKNGHLYLFDTKSAGSDSDAPKKHNALLDYIHENTTPETLLYGGVIIQRGTNWLYSTHPIEKTDNLTDNLLTWTPFYPEKA